VSYEYQYKLFLVQTIEQGVEYDFMVLMVSFATLLVYLDLYLMLRNPFVPVKKRKPLYRIIFGFWVIFSTIYAIFHSRNY